MLIKSFITNQGELLMKIRKQSYFVTGAVLLILLMSNSCSQPSSDPVSQLDTWLDRVELEVPFTVVNDTELTARLDHNANNYLIDSSTSEMLEGSAISGAVGNVTLMKGVIDTLKSTLTEQPVETNQIVTINKVAYTMPDGDDNPDNDFYIGLNKVKVVYDDSSFAVYIIWDFRVGPDITDMVSGPFYAYLDVVQEDNGSNTTTIVSNSGEDGQNYFNYNDNSGILIYKSEDDTIDDDGSDDITDHDYLIYTPTDLAMGYGHLRYIRLTSDPAKDFLVIQYDSEGIYLHEDDESETITLYWDIDTGYTGEFTGSLPASMSSLVSGWITPATETIATDLSIQALLPAIELVVVDLL